MFLQKHKSNQTKLPEGQTPKKYYRNLYANLPQSEKDYYCKLANEIKNSQEYISFQKSMKDIKSDSKSEKLLRDYKMIQLELQRCRTNNEKIDSNIIKNIDSIEKRVKNNKKVNNYLKYEKIFMDMMADINIILSNMVENDYK